MTQATQHPRGERLYPSRSARAYWHLVSLRCEIEAVIAEYIASQGHSLLVDYGCGNMPYRPLLEPHLRSYLGCDLPGNDLADCIVESPPTLPLESDSANIVLSSQVLEHVPGPSECLAEAFRVLKPRGYLVLSTHGVWKYHPDPIDYWRWTSADLAVTPDVRDADASVYLLVGRKQST